MRCLPLFVSLVARTWGEIVGVSGKNYNVLQDDFKVANGKAKEVSITYLMFFYTECS